MWSFLKSLSSLILLMFASKPECRSLNGPILKKRVFFNFLGPFDIFWTPKPCLVSETSLWGGHTSNILWSKQRFRSWKFHVLAPQFSKPNWFIIWNWFHNHYHSGDECCVAFTWNRKRWFPGLEVSQTFTQWLYNENKYFHFNRKVK